MKIRQNGGFITNKLGGRIDTIDGKVREKKIVRQGTPLSAVSKTLRLSTLIVQQLQALGVNDAESLLGLAYADPAGLAMELKISPKRIAVLVQRLREKLDPSFIEQLDVELGSNKRLPLGARLDQAASTHETLEYDKD